jgi:hypothetical protein
LPTISTLRGEHLCTPSKNHPQESNLLVFAQYQEACSTGNERDFGILQARFAMVRGPAHFWDKKSLSNIMRVCEILHKIIIKDQRALNLEFFFDNVGSRVKPIRNPDKMQALLELYRQIDNTETHTQFCDDLIEHQGKIISNLLI